MNFYCFRTLFKIHLFGNFSLSGPHHSHTGPLLFNGQYLVRLQFALGYNFLTILRQTSSPRPTAFAKLMSSMEVTIRLVLCAASLCSELSWFATNHFYSFQTGYSYPWDTIQRLCPCHHCGTLCIYPVVFPNTWTARA